MSIITNKQIEEAKRKVSSGPFTKPEGILDSDTALIYHELQNISCMLACSIDGLDGAWINVSTGNNTCLAFKTQIPAKDEVVLYTYVASERSEKELRKEILFSKARKSIKDYRETLDIENKHVNWWKDFWEKSFIEMPDKYIENLWYFGVYHQACFSRSLDAPGFLLSGIRLTIVHGMTAMWQMLKPHSCGGPHLQLTIWN